MPQEGDSIHLSRRRVQRRHFIPNIIKGHVCFVSSGACFWRIELLVFKDFCWLKNIDFGLHKEILRKINNTQDLINKKCMLSKFQSIINSYYNYGGHSANELPIDFIDHNNLTKLYCAFTLDVKSMLKWKSRWHPRWHPMLNGW